MNRGSIIRSTTEFIVEDCCNCGILFAMPADLRARRLEDHMSFYCPNGHPMSYTGPTAEQKAKREAERAQAEAARLRQQLASRAEDVRAARASLTATKGQLTRVRNRADKGVCQHCNRSFVNVARHVAGQHPHAVSS